MDDFFLSLGQTDRLLYIILLTMWFCTFIVAYICSDLKSAININSDKAIKELAQVSSQLEVLIQLQDKVYVDDFMERRFSSRIRGGDGDSDNALSTIL